LKIPCLETTAYPSPHYTTSLALAVLKAKGFGISFLSPGEEEGQEVE
jgi:hypothetical protein